MPSRICGVLRVSGSDGESVTIGHFGLRRSRFVLIPESRRLVRAEKLGNGRIPSRVAAVKWRLPNEFSRVVVRGLTT